MFGRTKPPMIGVDISSSSVKVLELRQASDGYRIEAYSLAPLAPEAVVEKNIADVEAVGAALRKAVAQAHTRTKHVAMAVPSSAVITKVIPMTAGMSEDEMEAQIELEADQYIPYPLEEVNLDFEVLGPTPNAQESVDVLLAASRNENVEMRSAVAEMAGLTAKVVDIEAYAVEHAFPLLMGQLNESPDDKTIAVVDVGATMTGLHVFRDSRLIYTREQAFGGRQLTEEIVRRYGLSLAEAGRAKRKGGLPDSYVPEVLEPFKDAMIQQINRLLQFFFSASQYETVDHLMIGGGCAGIPNIDVAIENRIGTPTNIANPFSHMSLSPRIDPQAISDDAPSLLIACGLSLRSFD